MTEKTKKNFLDCYPAGDWTDSMILWLPSFNMKMVSTGWYDSWVTPERKKNCARFYRNAYRTSIYCQLCCNMTSCKNDTPFFSVNHVPAKHWNVYPHSACPLYFFKIIKKCTWSPVLISQLNNEPSFIHCLSPEIWMQGRASHNAAAICSFVSLEHQFSIWVLKFINIHTTFTCGNVANGAWVLVSESG